ncbi:hypothetical protein [Methylovorus sp. MP688]|uniref:hypothetical protein n=1 Tax=Methylovorus sp. (strain MP688) TaxID=887061 RepID=UPI0001EC454C|nr:hypothetical protein [Methylovorus sp. MP688]ADQ84057.1 conserved hypothetical protein [Methylovorus sp. MP688]
MKRLNVHPVLFIALYLIPTASHATGLVALPATGFVTSGGTSAYTLCNQTGNFGSVTHTPPTAGANNTCAVFPSNINTSPVSGFTLVSGTSLTRTITANGQSLAFMDERVFRNAANTECIFAKRLRMNTVAAADFDYHPQRTGSQKLAVNDIAFAGFNNSTSLQAGYYLPPSVVEYSPIFRIGRTHTSVQMQANYFNPNTIATGYLAQPLTSGAPAASTEINGVGQTYPTPPGNPTAAQQTAAISANWVDFTLDISGGADEDGASASDSSVMYVRSTCSSAPPVALPNSVKIRQTGQETQPWVTISTIGFVPAGANTSF